MAKQTGPIKYKGTLGDVRHFKIKGLTGHYAGLVGGPTGEQVKTAPEFKRTRENMNEFGGCATAAKSIRVGLSQLMKQMSDPQLTGRLTSIMKKINLEDQSEARGIRSIQVSTQRQYLKGLNFNKNINFDSVFYAPYTVSNTPARDEGIFDIPLFDPRTNVNAPSGATHFRLISAISVISDFGFNSDSKVYEAIEPSLNELSNVQYSDYYDLNAPLATAVNISASVAGATMTTDVSVLNCVGIEFYQKVGANYYLFSQGNCLKVQDIF